MKNDYFSLLSVGFFLLFAVVFWKAEALRVNETRELAADVQTFLEDRRTISYEHLIAYEKARQLAIQTQSPNRAGLLTLCIALAVNFLISFFRSSTGRRLINRAMRIWTHRP